MHTCNQINKKLCELIIIKKVLMITKNKIRRFGCVNKHIFTWLFFLIFLLNLYSIK
jgi:hypothetical protein